MILCTFYNICNAVNELDQEIRRFRNANIINDNVFFVFVNFRAVSVRHLPYLDDIAFRTKEQDNPVTFKLRMGIVAFTIAHTKNTEEREDRS